MKFFIPTNKIRSAGALLEDAGVIKPSRPTPWERSRTVPVAVRNARIEADNTATRDEIRDILNAYRKPRSAARPVILG